jgi:hypothetical protein
VSVNNRLIVSLILLISFVTFVITSIRGSISFDVFWHLQMGKDWIVNGLSPWVDHYSFTYNGQTIVNPPVIFQSIIYFLVSQLGTTVGLQVFRFLCAMLTLGLTFTLLRQSKSPPILYAIVIPMMILLLQMRAIVRPELLSYAFSVLALILYFKAGNEISRKSMIPIVALMWAWSFYHSSIIGYVIFFGLFLDSAIYQYKIQSPRRDWLKWFAWGLAILLVGFLNPDFSHPMIHAVTFPSDWKSMITEYFPSPSYVESIAGIYVLILIALFVPILAFQQKRFGLIIVWAVMLYSAITMNRMFTPSGIVVLVMSAGLLSNSQVPRELKANLQSLPGWATSVGLFIPIGLILYSNVSQARMSLQLGQLLEYRYPVAMTKYMMDSGTSGRIFNEYEIGGYLISRLAPNSQVYIDGRTQILYPVEHMRHYEQLIKSSNDLFSELNKFDVDLLILKYSDAALDMLEDLEGFGLDYLDASYVLYRRGNANFPLFGRLLTRPECWRPDMLSELKAERRRMKEILPAYSSFFPFSDFVIGYSESEDGKAFFDDSIEAGNWSDEMRRFAGFRFLEKRQYEVVPLLLGGVDRRRPMDYLASAYAKIKSGDSAVAYEIIRDFSNYRWVNLTHKENYLRFELTLFLESEGYVFPAEQPDSAELKSDLLNLGFTENELNDGLESDQFCSTF